MWKEKKEVESWKKRLILRLQAPKLLLIFYDFFSLFYSEFIVLAI